MVDYNNVMKYNEILESERLLLRPFSIDDIEDVFEYAKDDQVTEFLTWESHNSISETEKIVKELYMNQPGIYAIELKSDQKCIGCIDLRVDIQNDKGSFGYVMNRSYWNRGYMSEALRLILTLAFSELELNRIESTYYAGNKASGRVMEKCGMKYEGTGLQELRVFGIYHDVVHYAILKEDYDSKWLI